MPALFDVHPTWANSYKRNLCKGDSWDAGEFHC